MSIEYLPSVTVKDALNLIKAFDNARFTHRTAAVLAQPPRSHADDPAYRYGTMAFNRMSDARDIIRMQAQAAGVRPDNVSGILTNDVISLSFNSGSDYLGVMSKLRGRMAIQGADMEVQVAGKSPEWHSLVESCFLKYKNAELNKKGFGVIKVASHPDQPEQTTYYFPTLSSMQSFCQLMNRGSIDRAVQKMLTAAPAAEPRVA